MELTASLLTLPCPSRPQRQVLRASDTGLHPQIINQEFRKLSLPISIKGLRFRNVSDRNEDGGNTRPDYPETAALGYARVSTYGQTLDAQLEQLRAAGCTKIYREKVTGARADRRELLKLLKALAPGDVVTVTRIDRLARSTFDLFAIVKQIVDAEAQFRSLAEPWADTGTSTAVSVKVVAARNFVTILLSRRRSGQCEPPTGDECATVLTAEKVRCSPSSPCSRATGRAARGCGWLRSSHLLRCAPWLGRCQVGTGKQARRSNRKAGFVRLPPG